MSIEIKSYYESTSGDAISHYKAEFVSNPTLEEFVNWILETNPEEWGDIRGVDFWTKYVEYRYGKIVELCDNYDAIKGKTISLKRMDGGWTNMDYTIEIEE
jgi:hypothetical protein